MTSRTQSLASSRLARRLPFLLALAILPLSAQNSHALSLGFSHDGFEEGASVTGSFTGADADSDGTLVHMALDGPAELTRFTLSFSGNSLVDAFSLDLSNLDYFVYHLGDNLLGNDILAPYAEGIAAFNEDHQYITGQGPTFTDGGFVLSPFNEDHSERSARVPDTGSAALLLGVGLAGLAAVRSRRT